MRRFIGAAPPSNQPTIYVAFRTNRGERALFRQDHGGLVMNERQTVLWIAWIFGGLVVSIFVLDIIAMS